MGAQQRSANFIVETPDPTFAQMVSQAAERYRHDLAIEWLGQAMPNWSQPCVMEVQVGPHLSPGGATQFVFDRGEVFDWRMTIQGSPQRILDSVVPHEITHMIYASHFRQPLPRWADEGGATSVEHVSEKNKHWVMLNQFLRTGRGIAFNQMFAMTDYPSDIMPLYAQGYSLAEFLIQSGGRRRYVEFLGDGLQSDNWSAAVERHYGIQDLGALQNTWLAWVRQGSPPLRPRQEQPLPAGEMLAANERRPRPEPNLIYRIGDKQSPVAPLADLVPVRMPSDRHASPARTAATALEWKDPSRSSSTPAGVPIVTADSRARSMALPASGWHVLGSTATAHPAPSAIPFSADPPAVQVTHPQAVEQPRQTVLQ
jgi:hypothetical protein